MSGMISRVDKHLQPQLEACEATSWPDAAAPASTP